ncbi:MAG TPA: hypothetical protein VGB00_02820 [Pyrinomonadaceae bacterium]
MTVAESLEVAVMPGKSVTTMPLLPNDESTCCESAGMAERNKNTKIKAGGNIYET